MLMKCPAIATRTVKGDAIDGSPLLAQFACGPTSPRIMRLTLRGVRWKRSRLFPQTLIAVADATD